MRAKTKTRMDAMASTRLAALAFIPVQGVFTRNEDDESDLISNPTFKQLEKYCEGWTVGRERGADDEDHLCRRFRAKDAKAGHRILEALQGRLMTEEERGCRRFPSLREEEERLAAEAAVANDDDVLGRLRCEWVIDAVSAILPPRVPTPDPRRPSASRTVGTCSIASSMECAAAAHDSAGFSSRAADSTRAQSPRSNT